MGVLDNSRWGFSGFALATALVAVACTSPAAADTPVKFTLDWKFEGPSAPFVVAIDRGYYKAQGLDVTIDTAGGSLEPINRIASGSYDMGFGDINSLIKFRDQNPGVAIKAIFMVYNKPAFSIVGRKSRGVLKPTDLEGKKLGAPPTDGAYAQWPIFVQANAIDTAKVTIVSVGFPVREPMLASGYGVDLYGNAILVSPKFAAEKPVVVRAFLRAFLNGLRETVKNPAAAIDSVLKRNDVVKRDTELERLNIALKENILTPEVIAEGYGGVDAGRLDKAINQIGLTYPFKAKPKPDEAFDASFLPDAAERKTR